MIIISFILAGILYRKFMFFFALRKKLLRSGKVLKTHATPTPALFIQKTPQKMSGKKLTQGKKYAFSLLQGKKYAFSLPQGKKYAFSFPREVFFRGNSFPDAFQCSSFWPFFGLGGRLKHSLRAGIPSKLKESTILDQKRIFTLEVVSCSDKSVSSGGL